MKLGIDFRVHDFAGTTANTSLVFFHGANLTLARFKQLRFRSGVRRTGSANIVARPAKRGGKPFTSVERPTWQTWLAAHLHGPAATSAAGFTTPLDAVPSASFINLIG